jgi:aminoglycoside phosphotransferase (APT) family kinase protein
MIDGAPQEARWHRPEPRREIPTPLLERIAQTAFPRQRVIQAEPLTDGWRNANFKLQLDGTPEFIVLRAYEHHASLCQKEIDLIRLVGNSVPVPEVIYAEPQGQPDFPPFALFRYVKGSTLRELKRNGELAAIPDAAYSAGKTLASVGRFAFPKPGWLGPGPRVAGPFLDGADPIPRFVDACLASPILQLYTWADLRDRTRDFVWSWAARLAVLNNESSLVHGDFGKRNIMVATATGKYGVVAVLDWEFAVSGSPLADVGHFLRYERISRPMLEPHFSRGYLEAGGKLPQNWRELARLVDLASLCESLTHEDLPDAVVDELVELVGATVENREPRLA